MSTLKIADGYTRLEEFARGEGRFRLDNDRRSHNRQEQAGLSSLRGGGQPFAPAAPAPAPASVATQPAPALAASAASAPALAAALALAFALAILAAAFAAPGQAHAVSYYQSGIWKGLPVLTQDQKVNLSRATCTLDGKTFEYDGANHLAGWKVSHPNNTPLVRWTDAQYKSKQAVVGSYRTSLSDQAWDKGAVDAGTYRISISGNGYDTYLSKTFTFTITKVPVSGLSITASNLGSITSAESKPQLSATRNGRAIAFAEGSCYQLGNPTFDSATGVYSATLTGVGNFEGTMTLTLLTKAVSMDQVSVSGVQDKPYNGSAITQDATLKIGGATLTQGVHYSVRYANNVNVGSATVTFSGIGSLQGSKQVGFEVLSCDISDATFSGFAKVAPYNGGAAVTQSPTVRMGDVVLTRNVDYTLSYENNSQIGTATMIATGKGGYEGQARATFRIAATGDLAGAQVAGVKSLVYNGSARTQHPTITDGDIELRRGEDYELSYANNVNAGTATMTITGLGAYRGQTRDVSFQIEKAPNPMKVTGRTESVSYLLTITPGYTAKLVDVSGAVGAVTYEGPTGGDGRLQVASNGMVRLNAAYTQDTWTVGGTMASTTVKVTAAGDGNYAPATKTVTVRMHLKPPSGWQLYNGKWKSRSAIYGGNLEAMRRSFTVKLLSSGASGMPSALGTPYINLYR